jgi:hypothetical protein
VRPAISRVETLPRDHADPKRCACDDRRREAHGVPAECLHKRGGAKAKLLLSLGYRTNASETLETDLRTQHLSLDATRTSQNAYGMVYEIEGPIKTPSGRIVRFVSVWQIDTETDVPRLITMYPR